MRRLSAVAAALAALLLAACSPDAGDFKEEAEKYIEGREFSEQAGLLRYTEVECEEPESTERDTRYVCMAIAEDGSAWRFEVEITGKSDLEVLIPPTPLSDGTGSSLPGDSRPATANSASTTNGATSTAAGGASTTAGGATTGGATTTAGATTTRVATTTTAG